MPEKDLYLEDEVTEETLDTDFDIICGNYYVKFVKNDERDLLINDYTPYYTDYINRLHNIHELLREYTENNNLNFEFGLPHEMIGVLVEEY